MKSESGKFLTWLNVTFMLSLEDKWKLVRQTEGERESYNSGKDGILLGNSKKYLPGELDVEIVRDRRKEKVRVNKQTYGHVMGKIITLDFIY